MKCPVCKSDLKLSGQLYLETLDEHVLNIEPELKDNYICSNMDCQSHKFKIHWNEFGERYSGFGCDKIFIDNNDAPFGSLWRKINAQHKEDENIRIKFFNVMFEIDWDYLADFDGNIISKKPSLKLWINHVLYVSGISMLFFMIQQHYRMPKSKDFFTQKKNGKRKIGGGGYQYLFCV
jgi:hypothetical protein